MFHVFIKEMISYYCWLIPCLLSVTMKKHLTQQLNLMWTVLVLQVFDHKIESKYENINADSHFMTIKSRYSNLDQNSLSC